MDWQRTGRSTIRSGEWLIVKFPWATYCLWQGEEFRGRYPSAELAKQAISDESQPDKNIQLDKIL